MFDSKHSNFSVAQLSIYQKILQLIVNKFLVQWNFILIIIMQIRKLTTHLTL